MSTTPLKESRKGSNQNQQQDYISKQQLGVLLLVLYYGATVRPLTASTNGDDKSRDVPEVSCSASIHPCLPAAFAWHRVWWVPQPQPADAPASLFSEVRAMSTTRKLADDIGDRAVGLTA